MNARETLDQLTQSNENCGVIRLTAMIGAKNFITDNNCVSFRFQARAKNKSNYLRISLTEFDTYDVTFSRVYGKKKTVIKEYEGIYNDQLMDLFQRETGLYLKF